MNHNDINLFYIYIIKVKMDTLYRNIIKEMENIKLKKQLHLQNIEKFENFFDFIPIDVIEIIISYLSYNDFNSFSKTIDINHLNYSMIYKYRSKEENKKMTHSTYKTHLIYDNIKSLIDTKSSTRGIKMNIKKDDLFYL